MDSFVTVAFKISLLLGIVQADPIIKFNAEKSVNRRCGSGSCAENIFELSLCPNNEYVIGNLTESINSLEFYFDQSLRDNYEETVRPDIESMIDAKLEQFYDRLETRQLENTYKLYCLIGGYPFYLDGSCYVLKTTPRNFEDARVDCQAQLADLLVIESHDEFNSFIGKVYENTWIGLSDLDVEGSYNWVDGTPLDNILAADWWHTGEPNDSTGIQNCVQYWYFNYTLALDDVECSELKQYICEIKVSDFIN